MVLGTDMKQHFSNCLVFSNKVSEAKGMARAVAEAGDRCSNAGSTGDTEGPTASGRVTFGPSSSAEPDGSNFSGCSLVGRTSAPRLAQLSESTTLLMHRSCATNSVLEAPSGGVGASSRRRYLLKQQGVRTKSDMSHERYRASMLAGSSHLRPSSLAAATMDRPPISSKGLRLSGAQAVDPMTSHSPVVRTDGQQADDPFLASAIAHLTTDDADRLLVWKVRHVERVAKALCV